MLTCVCGLGWGDEGKGKVVDAIGGDYDVVVRYNGGANAGHTVVVGDTTFKLHHLPCGAIRDKQVVLTAGMVVDPIGLLKEIDELTRLGHPPNLMLDPKIHVVMPWHFRQDRQSGGMIGTTQKGIGPCYADKMVRKKAIRLGDLRGELQQMDTKVRFGVEGVPRQTYCDAACELYRYIGDTGKFLRQEVAKGTDILFESANGIHLDIDHGTFPFVTSSAVGPAAIPQSCGLPNVHLDRIIGVIKCYATRVGEGPFPSEISGKLADRIREAGNEFGTTTGRPRRIGWFDIDKTKEAVELTGATEIAIMHFDTLEGMDHIRMMIGGELIYLKGWTSLLGRGFYEFVKTIEQEVGVPVSMAGYGPERDQIEMRSVVRHVVGS